MDTGDSSDTVTLEEVQAAAERIRSEVPPSPVIHSSTLSGIIGGEVYLKAESLQRTGSFKIRGALNKLLSLNEQERKKGVIAASAGNHAQGVALAAKILGIPSTIVMPHGTPLTKQLRTAGYGAKIIIEGQDYDEAYEAAFAISQAEGIPYVHAFNDRRIVAGQGTCGLEILDQVPKVDYVICPIGGGGLIGGMSAAIRALSPKTKIIGVQAEGSPSAQRALEAGAPVTLSEAYTLADGIRVRRTGDIPFELIRQNIDEVITVPDEETTDAIAWLLSDAKLVVEAAGAVGVAAVMNQRLDLSGKTVCIVLSGGNIDLGLLARVVESSRTKVGRCTYLELLAEDRPGELSKVVQMLAEQGINILEVEHHRAGWRVPVGKVAISFLIETRDSAHAARVSEMLEAGGWRLISHGSPLLEG